MKNFYELFSKMINYGFMGVYKRLVTQEEDIDTRFVPALAKACGIASFLNFKYNLMKQGKRILPETEFQMFQMFELPLADIIDKLPDNYKSAILDKEVYYGVDALFEGTDNGKGVLTEDGYNFLSNPAIYASKDAFDQMGEYNGQRIFEELCNEDYVGKRMFLEQQENVYIPENCIYQSDEQTRFIKGFPELHKMCYQKNTRLKLYRCKRCGMILREHKKNVFSCVSKKCNQYLEEKIEIVTNGPGWVMNDIVARNIFYPGRLEQKIKGILDEAKEEGIVKEYILWPGEYEGQYDTWDFKVIMANGRTLLIDAKDVENPHWIITDLRKYIDGADFIYVVPDEREKSYVEQINNHEKCIGKVECVRVKELRKIVGVSK